MLESGRRHGDVATQFGVSRVTITQDATEHQDHLLIDPAEADLA